MDSFGNKVDFKNVKLKLERTKRRKKKHLKSEWIEITLLFIKFVR